jgi:hypothetical protein
MPATASAVADTSLPDSVLCTAATLRSMGYYVVDSNEKIGIVRAERLKHVTNPFRGQMDADRITVFLDPNNASTGIRVLGETVGTPPFVLLPRTRRVGGVVTGPVRDLGVVRKWTSKEVADDTQALATSCGS